MVLTPRIVMCYQPPISDQGLSIQRLWISSTEFLTDAYKKTFHLYFEYSLVLLLQAYLSLQRFPVLLLDYWYACG